MAPFPRIERCDVLVVLVQLLSLCLCPYTKVEESFNVQAVHDLLYTSELERFDHLEFAGVVPRTFLGPLVLAGMAAPFKPLLVWAGLHKEAMLLVGRFMLGLLFACSFTFLRRCFAQRFAVGRGTDSERRLRNAIAVASCCQFHLLFYSTRPLANTLAALCVNVAFGFWLRSSGGTAVAASSPGASPSPRAADGGRMVAALAVACIVFRCDMLLLSACLIASSLLYHWLSLRSLLLYGTLASAMAIPLSVIIDSNFWQQKGWLWPEWEVLYYNTLAAGGTNSEKWGVEPAGWYFTRAIPKALLGGLLVLPFALVRRVPRRFAELGASMTPDGLALRFLLPSLGFVVLYSRLPHKELRFIYPLLPLLACFIGLGLWKIREARREAREKAAESSSASGRSQQLSFFSLPNLLLRGAQLVLLLSFLVSALSLYVSSRNYPGGEALHRFHSLLQAQARAQGQPLAAATAAASAGSSGEAPVLHICNLAATTGASRFGQHDSDSAAEGQGPLRLRYSKEEGLTPAQLVARQFDFLIVEAEADSGAWPAELGEAYAPLGSDTNDNAGPHSPALIYTFDRLRRPTREDWWPVQQKPALWLLARKTPEPERLLC